MKKVYIAAAFALASSAVNATPIELVTNGDFETGTFVGWSTATGPGQLLINDGTVSTAIFGTRAPIGGSFDAMLTSTGINSNNDLSQVFVIPENIVSATISWDDRILNNAGAYSDPNQEFRVMLETLGGLDITEIFSTNPGDTLVQNGPNSRSFDITSVLQANEGTSIRLSFERQDNLQFFHTFIDNVSINAQIPEPATTLLFGLGLAGLGFARRAKA